MKRSVYDDDPRTTCLWAEAFKSGGTSAINDMIVNQLGQFFPDATILETQITKTYFQDWPNAWH